jgi:uncharacterized protein
MTYFVLEKLVMQSTSLCNMNCRYCYVYSRNKALFMSPQVADKVAHDISDLREPLKIFWHAGEPLTCGLDHLGRLLRPFRALQQSGMVRHALQTNATLITRDWCDFFVSNNIDVGVSIDGPRVANHNRVDWAGRATYDAAMAGIECLESRNIQFSTVCVVDRDSLSKATELYDFFCELGCYSVGFNIEEQEGANGSNVDDDEAVLAFWRDLFAAWRENPAIRVREFEWTLGWMNELCKSDTTPDTTMCQVEQASCDIFPSVAYDGNVVLLSPGFVGAKALRYNNFVVGNALSESLLNIVARCGEVDYIKEYVEGVDKCRHECEHFQFCGGGQASNKFFELGSTGGTETAFCRNAKKRLVSAVVQGL